MKNPRLENWGVQIPAGLAVDGYMAPEQLNEYMVLSGEIYDDDRFDDGTRVSTSIIEELDVVKGFARTRNTTYILGTIHSEYQAHLDKSEEDNAKN